MKQNKKDFTQLKFPNQMTLTPEMDTIITMGGYGNYEGGSTIDEEVQKKMKQMESLVKQISKTEIILQTDYWTITNFYMNKKLATVRKK